MPMAPTWDVLTLTVKTITPMRMLSIDYYHAGVYRGSMIEGYENAKELGERLGIDASQVRRLAIQGRIPGAVKVPGGAWLFPKGVKPVGRGKRGPRPDWLED
jgi:hypothetical protein